MERLLDEIMPCKVTTSKQNDRIQSIKPKSLLHYSSNYIKKKTQVYPSINMPKGKETSVYHLNMDFEEIKIANNSCCKRVWQKIKLHITRTCYLHRRFLFDEITMIPPPGIQPTFLREWNWKRLALAMEGEKFSQPPWSYRGEGNANLVISLPEEKIIFRFHKLEYDVRIESDVIKQEEHKVKRDVQFGNDIVTKFIGLAYVQPPHYTKLHDDDAITIDMKIHKMRPSHRRHKGIRCGWVTISPDYAFLPPILSGKEDLSISSAISMDEDITFCVELKPKQGWVHPDDRHHPKCTFCLNQYLKFERKCVSKISSYCPLDLFSGDEERMTVAIRNLLETPQNNLKIFQDGLLVYSDDYGNYLDVLKRWLEPYSPPENIENEWLIKKWCNLIQRSLIRQLTEEPLPHLHLEEILSNTNHLVKKNYQDYDGSPLSKLFPPCDWSTNSLPTHCILNRILLMQKLQTTGFKRVYDQFKKLNKEETDYSYCKRIAKCNNLNLIERYLLATTAKDCSIMIAFRRIHDSQSDVDTMNFIEDCDGVGFIMNIGVSDLDAKPLSCIKKHNKRDQDVITACLHAAARVQNIQPTSYKLSANHVKMNHCSSSEKLLIVD